jgi:hypothetical protein
MLVEALQNVLTTAAPVTALVGTAATRTDGTNGVFPTQAIDQPTMPYIVVSQSNGEPLQTSMAGTGRLTSERWSIACYGTTYGRAKRLAKTVRQVLLSLDGQQAGNAFVCGAWCRLESDTADALAKGTLFSTTVTFDFLYQDGD